MDVADLVDRDGKMAVRRITAKPRANQGNKRIVDESAWGPFKGRRVKLLLLFSFGIHRRM